MFLNPFKTAEEKVLINHISSGSSYKNHATRSPTHLNPKTQCIHIIRLSKQGSYTAPKMITMLKEKTRAKIKLKYWVQIKHIKRKRIDNGLDQLSQKI